MTKLGVLFSVLGVGAGCIPAFAQKQLPIIPLKNGKSLDGFLNRGTLIGGIPPIF